MLNMDYNQFSVESLFISIVCLFFFSFFGNISIVYPLFILINYENNK